LLQKHLVRLACIRHAASVHPEPGSNSPQKIFTLASVVYGFFTGSTELLLPITVQLLKFWFQSGLHFTRAALACQDINRRKHRCLWTSARQTATLRHAQGGHHRLVSLTRDSQFSLICQGTRSCECTGEFLLYALWLFCQEVIRQLTLEVGLIFLSALSTKGHSLTSKFASFSWNVLAGGLYALCSSCQGFLRLISRIAFDFLHTSQRLTFYLLYRFQDWREGLYNNVC
jgi:hypothetical protein